MSCPPAGNVALSASANKATRKMADWTPEANAALGLSLSDRDRPARAPPRSSTTFEHGEDAGESTKSRSVRTRVGGQLIPSVPSSGGRKPANARLVMGFEDTQPTIAVSAAGQAEANSADREVN